ncbi:MAG: hypothetical protein ACQETH_12145 [Candidatus Rifleibacteriota bacterium]
MKTTNKNNLCPNCGSLNFSYARFCGKCGLNLALSESGKYGKFVITWIKKQLKAKKDLILFKTAKLVGVITVMGFLVFSIPGKDFIWQSNQEVVKWGEAKSYFTEKLQIPGEELDFLFAKVTNDTPSISSEFDLNKLLKLQNAIRSRLRDTSISLFPNPYFECPEVVVKKDDKNISPFVFCDIPLDHPAYKAIKPLFDIGLDCGTRGLKFRPYDRLSWSEWNSTLNQLEKVLALPENYFVWKISSSGFINNGELMKSINRIKRKLGLETEKVNVGSARVSYPSRIESFANLVSVIEELQAIE